MRFDRMPSAWCRSVEARRLGALRQALSQHRDHNARHIHEDIHMVFRVLHRDGWWALTKTAQRPVLAVLPFTSLVRHMPQCHQLADAVVVRFRLAKPAGFGGVATEQCSVATSGIRGGNPIATANLSGVQSDTIGRANYKTSFETLTGMAWAVRCLGPTTHFAWVLCNSKTGMRRGCLQELECHLSCDAWAIITNSSARATFKRLTARSIFAPYAPAKQPAGYNTPTNARSYLRKRA
jgi:hypothetical protein